MIRKTAKRLALLMAPPLVGLATLERRGYSRLEAFRDAGRSHAVRGNAEAAAVMRRQI
jgi:hypothetical protein